MVNDAKEVIHHIEVRPRVTHPLTHARSSPSHAHILPDPPTRLYINPPIPPSHQAQHMSNTTQPLTSPPRMTISHTLSSIIYYSSQEAFHHIRTSHDASTQSEEQPAEPPVVLPSVVEDATITSTGAEQEGDLYDVTFPTQVGFLPTHNTFLTFHLTFSIESSHNISPLDVSLPLDFIILLSLLVQAALGLTLLPTKLPIGEGGKTLDVCVVSRSAFTSLIKEVIPFPIAPILYIISSLYIP